MSRPGLVPGSLCSVCREWYCDDNETCPYCRISELESHRDLAVRVAERAEAKLNVAIEEAAKLLSKGYRKAEAFYMEQIRERIAARLQKGEG